MITDWNIHHRNWLHVRRPDLAFYGAVGEIPTGTEYLVFGRTKASHKGLAAHAGSIRELSAKSVDQSFLEEIAQLSDLEYLSLGWPVTATDLAPLTRLAKLRQLVLEGPRNIFDFTPILALPRLERLFIENARHLADLTWMTPLKDRLVALGIEGSMYTAQAIHSLKPLAGFGLEALFLTNTRLADQDLSPVATMPKIRFLGTGINAPLAEFQALKAARPDLQCSWFDEGLWAGFRDPRPPKR